MPFHVIRIAFAVLAAGMISAGISGCGSSGSSNTAAQNLKAGTYGGNSMELDVASSGQTIQIDCGAATLDKPIKPDAAGTFSTTGTYEGFYGPPAVAEKPHRGVEAVRYFGTVSGNVIHMNIINTWAVAPFVKVDLTYNTKIIPGNGCPP